MSGVQAKPVTPDDLLAMPDGKMFELVDGELVEKNVSVLSSWVEGRLFRILDTYCSGSKLGIVLPASTGIRCFPHDSMKVRRPDVFFVKQERFQSRFWHDGFLMIPPDLAAEVVSPNDLANEVNEKVEEYLGAGIPLVWVIDPEIKTVIVHRSDGTLTKLHQTDELSGETIIPGFRCKVSELFPE